MADSSVVAPIQFLKLVLSSESILVQFDTVNGLNALDQAVLFGGRNLEIAVRVTPNNDAEQVLQDVGLEVVLHFGQNVAVFRHLLFKERHILALGGSNDVEGLFDIFEAFDGGGQGLDRLGEVHVFGEAIK
eukprot:scaffold116148_cov24-Attheya_sp.AAC.2